MASIFKRGGALLKLGGERCLLLYGFALMVLACTAFPLCGEPKGDAKANPPEAPIRPGDTVVVATGPAPVKIEDKTLTTLEAGTEFKAIAVQEAWVKVAVEKDGQKITGWINKRHLKFVAPPAPEKAPDAPEVNGEAPAIETEPWVGFRGATEAERIQEYAKLMEAVRTDFPFRPMKEWKGMKFVFLPRPKSSQKYGYQSFKGGKGEFGQPTYDECVGRTGTVVDVRVEIERLKSSVTLAMDDTGQRLTAEAFQGSVNDIAPVEDIEKARRKWKGKTLWINSKIINTYNASTDKFGTVEVKKCGPVIVEDVRPGWFDHTPVMFCLRTADGRCGFADCNLSGTNVWDSARNLNRLEERFFLADPRTMFLWDEKVWAAIETASVFIGMTQQQARMSWGPPKDVRRTTTAAGRLEHWSYRGDNSLDFENGILAVIRN